MYIWLGAFALLHTTPHPHSSFQKLSGFSREEFWKEGRKPDLELP
jgi:hypothetical protein